MSQEQTPEPRPQSDTMVKVFPATVIQVVDAHSVAINRGHIHGIKKGQTFIIYGLSDKDLVDPESGENLGRLEIVRGTGVVVNVQEKMATIESNVRSKTKRIIKRAPRSRYYIYGSGFEETETVEDEGVLIALDDPEVGDKARPI